MRVILSLFFLLSFLDVKVSHAQDSIRLSSGEHLVLRVSMMQIQFTDDCPCIVYRPSRKNIKCSLVEVRADSILYKRDVDFLPQISEMMIILIPTDSVILDSTIDISLEAFKKALIVNRSFQSKGQFKYYHSPMDSISQLEECGQVNLIGRLRGLLKLEVKYEHIKGHDYLPYFEKGLIQVN